MNFHDILSKFATLIDHTYKLYAVPEVYRTKLEQELEANGLSYEIVTASNNYLAYVER